MAGPILRSVGESPGVASTTCVVVKPAGLTVDDLMVAHIYFKGHGSGDPPIAAPGGWTDIRQDSVYISFHTAALFWKIADAADVAAADFTFTGEDALNLGAISAWTGHDAITPINANNGQGNEASTTVTSPAITPSVANCAILLFCAVANDNTQSAYAIATSDPGLDEAYDFLTTAKTDCAIAMAEEIRPETTSTGNGTATTSSSAVNIGQLIAIAPVSVVAFIPTVTII